jgi:tripartite-type tricarboxylate transporter receptor subunit TctC
MTRLRRKRYRGPGRSAALAVTVVAFCAAISAAQAQTNAEPTFAHKTITIYVGNTAGGSYDFYARVAARYLGRHIPGNPTVVVENMPGAGSIRLANYMQSAAPKDGTALGIVVETLAIEQALGNPAVQYDARRYYWIGRLAASAGVHVMWHTSKVQSLDDAKRTEALVAGTGAGSLAETIPTLLNALIGTKFKLVRGYPASNEAMQAMERGEVEGVAANWVNLKASKPEWIRDHKIKVIVQDLPTRRADLPDVPALGELGTTQEAKQLFGLYGSMGAIGRSLFTAPGVPPSTVKILRDAFTALSNDKGFLADVKRTGGELDIAPGAQLQQAVEKTLDISQSTVSMAKSIFPAQ